jgi:hypothetical protein
MRASRGRANAIEAEGSEGSVNVRAICPHPVNMPAVLLYSGIFLYRGKITAVPAAICINARPALQKTEVQGIIGWAAPLRSPHV